MSLGYEVHIAVTFLYKILVITVLQMTLDIACEFNIRLRLFGLLGEEINLIKNKPNCFILCAAVTVKPLSKEERSISTVFSIFCIILRPINISGKNRYTGLNYKLLDGQLSSFLACYCYDSHVRISELSRKIHLSNCFCIVLCSCSS